MIDFEFIQQLEGNTCEGYVPDADNSLSGVTIGCGFDLGARSKGELRKAFTDELATKLEPYARLKKQQAADFLALHPLSLTEPEVAAINRYSKQQAVQRLITLWNKERHRAMAFDELPDICQTVIASVAFQYGDLSQRTPLFWQQVTACDWPAALQNLRNFGDRYPTRRNTEAELLAGFIEATA